jgi:uncharacterized protein (TIGR02996 family)
MTGDDAAFLRAIAEAPAHDAPRLVYADWLDEHGQADRAEFIRRDGTYVSRPAPADLRCRWRRDPPAAEDRYPPDLGRLTELAAGLPFEWVVSISRLGHEIEALVDRFAARVRVIRGPRPSPAPAVQAFRWGMAVRELQEMFETHVGEGPARDRFVVPVDYALFAAGPSGLACPDEYPFDALFGPDHMADRTVSDCDMYARMHGPGEHLAKCGLWLFAGFQDKHDFHVCCDRASPLFGTVVDLHDGHPWIGPPGGPEPWEVQTRSFLDFLRLQAADAEPH